CAVAMALMCAFPPQVDQTYGYRDLKYSAVWGDLMYSAVWKKPKAHSAIDVWRLLTQLGIPAFPALAALVVVREK
ncbi:MAG TPA: hypothetical protein VFJ30_15570, partial [Phycisphaerae bacterium]|nr:hypothetical protein [Phycisphaerae bacterium]